MKIKTASSYTTVSLIIIYLFLLIFLTQIQGQASAAVLSLSPSSGSYNTGNSFDVEIKLNTEGEEVISGGVYLNYNADILAIVDADSEEEGIQISAMNTVLEMLVINKVASGQVRLEGINFNSTLNGSNLLLGTITFKAIGSGYASVDYDSTCFIGRDVDGSNILTTTNGGSYTIEAASIPTLSEWGLIIFMTLMIGIGVMILRKRRMA